MKWTLAPPLRLHGLHLLLHVLLPSPLERARTDTAEIISSRTVLLPLIPGHRETHQARHDRAGAEPAIPQRGFHVVRLTRPGGHVVVAGLRIGLLGQKP